MELSAKALSSPEFSPGYYEGEEAEGKEGNEKERKREKERKETQRRRPNTATHPGAQVT